jgi:hypothetical protein
MDGDAYLVSGSPEGSDCSERGSFSRKTGFSKGRPLQFLWRHDPIYRLTRRGLGEEASA